MKPIKAFTLNINSKSHKPDRRVKEITQTIHTMKEVLSINTVMIVFGAWQETPHSEEILYDTGDIPEDGELEEIIAYAHSAGLQVFLKPMVNCRNGVWRAYISFFDVEAPCEAKGSRWFTNYERYLLHYARLAQRTDCEMLVIGCELVMMEKREIQWRSLISHIRQEYQGMLTYNADKYQEGNVTWWDAVDVISSSGYYPIHKWEENLNRIEKLLEHYQKPFFFAECGMPSRSGSSKIPNDWTHVGVLDLEEQREYYEVMFRECRKREWVMGFCGWDWRSSYLQEPVINDDYSVYGKPAAYIIHDFYKTWHTSCERNRIIKNQNQTSSKI